MATNAGDVNGYSEFDIGDSRKRTLDSKLDIGSTKRSHHVNGMYHFKILVPSVAAGAIIGKGGETVAQLQKETGARIKMSKTNDYYPGTTERVCLVTGSMDGIIQVHEFIMEKIREKPDPNARMAIDFDQKQPAEREKQVKILVPNSTAGMIIGKGGSYIKQIKDESGSYVQVSQKSKDHALAERCITVIGEKENNKKACVMILAKIVEDPQSGSCLNVSYAEASGPVANFNPTGSPFAATIQGNGGMNTSNTRYSSNGSLNSLSPTVNNSFGSPQGMGNSSGVIPFSAGMGMSIGAPPIPSSNISQIVENIKAVLGGNGYSDQATAEITAAVHTLSNYGVLGLGLNLGNTLHSMNGTPVTGGMGIGIGTSASNSCAFPSGGLANQRIFNSGTVPAMDGSCPVSASSSAPMGGSSNMFGSLTTNIGNSISGLGLGANFSSPTISRSGERYMFQTDQTVYDPFRQNSPALGSPGATSLPINNNSFGLGTSFSSGPTAFQRSPIPNDRQGGFESSKLEFEVGENIVGAILGPGGKSLVDIQRLSGANIQISKKGIFAPGTRNRIVSITGSPSSVSTAQYLIEQQISEEEAKRAQQNSMGNLR
ncbi:RNA-binding protein Pasilla-like isoform X1 [Tachypleus tridentatus]|uniref:RNA-binding protein Pasilla-like isoform X1 n=2 Tax=Tachypleus tridentatus TaxID=6853 RepID=UPI003FD577DD